MEGEGGANAAILELLNGEEIRRLVHDPNFEQNIFGETWVTDKPWKALVKIGAMNPLNADLVKFFEFALGKSCADLSNANPPG